jgi:aromatic-L-amino-acid decarboxylase
MEEKKRSFHMEPQDFVRCAGQAAEWIASYQRRVESLPVRSSLAPGAIRQALPPCPPQFGEPFTSVLEDLEKIILPGLTHWQSPHFFAFFPANASGPAILGDLISSGLGVQGMLWATSPACTELEAHVLDWLAGMLGLPNRFLSGGAGGGVIQDSASSAALCALLAARERATEFRSNEEGCAGGLTAYASDQAHSSIEKAAGIAGMGRKNLRKIPTGPSWAMDPARLAGQIAQDRQAGRIPFFVCATAGTTSALAFDPLDEIAGICRAERLWLHVDAAMAGTAFLCPEFRGWMKGIEWADSFCFNPHKWMFTNFDCDCFYVASRSALTGALGISPEYLKNPAGSRPEAVDYRDWQIPLGRRFRALKLWMVIRHYGWEGLRHHIRQHVALASTFADWVQGEDSFELAAPVHLNLVCFRHRQGDAFNRRLLETLNDSGRLFLSHAVLGGRFVLRFCVGQTFTEERHVTEAWNRIKNTAAEMARKG